MCSFVVGKHNGKPKLKTNNGVFFMVMEDQQERSKEIHNLFVS